MAEAPGGRPYVVQPRDTVLTIALMHDLAPQAIVDANPEMFTGAAARDPQMLAPGEVLLLPSPTPPEPSVAPQVKNRFVARVPRVHLHLAFEDEGGPMADEPFVVPGVVRLPDETGRRDARAPLEGTLDGEGRITLIVPALLGTFVLTFPERHVDHVVEVGGLDPVDQRRGREARLRHRGFLPVDQALDDPYRFETAIAERETLKSFQRAFDLQPSGYSDPPTQARLRDEHGS